MITIVHYGLGNISAFANVYERLNIPVSIATTADDLKTADKIILPGVGSFDHAMNKLNVSGMRSTLEERVLVQRVPVLGICVGMQMLGQSSDEGVLPGLGWIDGTVKKFDITVLKSKTQLPHMGWNTIQPVNRRTATWRILTAIPVFTFCTRTIFNAITKAIRLPQQPTVYHSAVP